MSMLCGRSDAQRGSALPLILVLLLLLTMMALGGVSDSVLQERMAHNKQRVNLSFQAAESGLRHAEQQLRSGELSLPVGVCLDLACEVPVALQDSGPGPGWHPVPAAVAGNDAAVWFHILRLGDSTLAVNPSAGVGSTLYRVLVLSRRDSTQTLLEAVYAHSRL